MKNQLIGAGKVQNGRMSFIGKQGGFIRPVVRKETPVINEVVVQGDVDILFNFVHERKHQPLEIVGDKVIHLRLDIKEEVSAPEQFIESILAVGKKITSPITHLFFGGK